MLVLLVVSPHSLPSQNTMLAEDMVEMICDWAAIAQEVEANEWASPRTYFKKTAVDKYGFDQSTIGRIWYVHSLDVP